MELAINKIRKPLREAAAKLGLPGFWRWWLGELAPLVPQAPRAALQRRRLRPVLAFGVAEAVLWELSVVDGAVTLVEGPHVALDGDPAAVAHAGRTLIEALPRRGGVSGSAKVVVALPPAQVLRKRITLPAAVEENLIEALAFDLDRHTPFRADQLYFDAVVVGRDLVKKEILVDWAAALRTAVDAARRHAENWGAAVVRVTPEQINPAFGAAASPARWSKLNLVPEAERPDTIVFRRPQFWVPALLLCAALIVAVVLPVWQKRDYVIALAASAEQARGQAAASDALRQQLDRVTGDYNFALSKKYAYPSTVQLLDDVTKLLPDDTWITQLDVKNTPKGKEPHREIMLRGESGNAGRLIAALEDSKLFEQAAPRSPTTKIQPGPGEVFDLGAQLKPLALPEAVQLVNEAPPKPEVPATQGATSSTPAAAPNPAATTATGVAPSAGTAGPAGNPSAGGAPTAATAAVAAPTNGGAAPVPPPAPANNSRQPVLNPAGGFANRPAPGSRAGGMANPGPPGAPRAAPPPAFGPTGPVGADADAPEPPAPAETTQ